MVLLHPAMRFRGLAAVLTLLTVVVVASGVVGRYIYTRVPRTVAVPVVGQAVTPPGVAPGPASAVLPLARVTPARKGLATWRAVHVPLTFVLFIVAFVHIVGAVYYATLLR